jgi:hypothetical protein
MGRFGLVTVFGGVLGFAGVQEHVSPRWSGLLHRSQP